MYEWWIHLLNFQVSDDTDLDTDEQDEEEDVARSGSSIEDKIENYVKAQEVTLDLPFGTVQVGARNLDNDQMDIKFKFGGETGVAEGENSLWGIFHYRSTNQLFSYYNVLDILQLSLIIGRIQ